MSFELPPIGGPGRPQPPPGPAAAGAAPGFADALRAAADQAMLGADPGSVPASPPPHLRSEVEAAAARYEQLERMGRELHFSIDEENGVVVEVRDLEGRLIRTVPSSAALDIATGASPDDV